MLKINLIRKVLLILSACAILLAGCGGAPNNNGSSTGNTSNSVKLGSGAGGSFVEGELTATFDNGGTWTVSVTVVDQNNNPVNTVYEVSFSSSCALAELSSFSSDTVSTLAGRASVTYSSESCTGVDVITATITEDGAALTADVDINVDSAVGGGGGGNSSIKLGSGAGSSFTEGELTATLNNEGTAAWTVNVTVVDQNNSPVNTVYEVSFSSSCALAELSSFSSDTASTLAGRASVIYSSESCTGVDVITATITSGAAALTANVDINVDSAVGGGNNSSVKLGSSAGSSFTEGELEAALNSEGTAAWTVNATVVNQNNNPVSTVYEVSFSSSCVTAGLSSFSSQTVSTVAGRASVIYSSDSCSGVDVVTATITSEGTALTADVDIDIDAFTGGVGGGSLPRIGSISDAGFVPGVLRSTLTSLPAGGSTTITAAIVDANDNLVTDPLSFSFTSPCAANALSHFENFDPSVTTPNIVETSTGSASIRYVANGCSGTDRVTATVLIIGSGGSTVSASIDLTIALDQVLGLNFVSAEPSQLALSGTGGVETSTVTFKLVGAQGGAIVGETVSFELSSTIGGISLSEETAVTDSSGLASTIVQAGTVSTSINVRATHDATGTESFSEGIVISSGVAVDSKFSLSLETHVPPDAFDTDGIESDVTVIASDYFGNDAVDGTQVFFASPESGNIGSSCTLVDGTCSVVWRSAGTRPGDLRAGIIAYTAGAENYTDNNGNNVYDGSDTFTALNDLGEPYVDENENDLYDIGEFFVDENNDEDRDTGNGLWDGPCLASVNASADCSGADSVFIYKTAVVRMPTNTPRVISSEVSYDMGSTWMDVTLGSGTISTSLSPNATALFRLVIGDSNTSADAFGSHPLPEGALINSSLDDSNAGELSGDTSIRERGGNQVYPATIVLVLSDDTPGANESTTLETNASLAERFNTTFSWNVDFDSP